MSKKNIQTFTAAILVLSMIAFIAYYRQRANTASEQNQGANNIKETTVKRGEIKIGFLSDGKTDLNTIKLKFPISGKIKDINVKTGDKVKRGAILAKLDDINHVNKLETAKINYQLAVTKLNKTKEQYEIQLTSEKSKLDNLKFQLDSISAQYFPMLEVKDGFSSQDIESKRLAYENSKKAYESAMEAFKILSNGSKDMELDKIDIEQKKLAIKIAQDELEDMVIKAPIDGEILNVSNSVGETARSDSDFITIADTGRITVVASVPEAELPRVEPGQYTAIEFDALQGRIFMGRVDSIEPIPIVDSSGLVTYNVNIIFEDKAEDSLKSGMTCTVNFILKQKKSILLVPYAAVKREDGKSVVEVKDDKGSIVSKEIKTGLIDGENVELIAGLTEGEKVLLRSKK